MGSSSSVSIRVGPCSEEIVGNGTLTSAGIIVGVGRVHRNGFGCINVGVLVYIAVVCVCTSRTIGGAAIGGTLGATGIICTLGDAFTGVPIWGACIASRGDILAGCTCGGTLGGVLVGDTRDGVACGSGSAMWRVNISTS